jgi:sugar/nucleoside kinase (ribokinase family)
MENNKFRVAIIGYASNDYSMRVAKFESVGKTTLVSKRLTSTWPEAGGIARIFAGLSGSVVADAISWVGKDAQSKSWKEEVEKYGGNTEGVDSLAGHSPSAYVFHDGSGDTECFFDPGLDDPSAQELSLNQDSLLSIATHVVTAIGPEPAARMMLGSLNDSVVLIWIVKADAESLPLDLRALMFARANVVIYSHQEDPFLRSIPLLQSTDPLDSPFHKKLVIRTAGNANIEWATSGVRSSTPVTPITREINATGAGDFFAGSFVANYLLTADPGTSIQKASDAAFHFLESRTTKSEE